MDTTEAEIKDVILVNFSDTLNTTEAAPWLESIHMEPNELLMTFNCRYKALHHIAFGLSADRQTHKPTPTQYTSKTIEKIRYKTNLYIEMLEDAFININRETSFVNIISEQKYENKTRIDTQINKLDESFQNFGINYMNTKSSRSS